jgi:hypothetical protein
LRALLTILACLLVALFVRTAHAEPNPRVFLAPTAQVQPDGQWHLTGGLTHRFEGYLGLTYGFSGLSDIGFEIEDRIELCDTCAQGNSQAEPFAVPLPSLTFKLRAPRWVDWQPDVAVGFRKPLMQLNRLVDTGEIRAGELYFVATQVLGPVQLHGGVDLLQATDLEGTAQPVGTSAIFSSTSAFDTGRSTGWRWSWPFGTAPPGISPPSRRRFSSARTSAGPSRTTISEQRACRRRVVRASSRRVL